MTTFTVNFSIDPLGLFGSNLLFSSHAIYCVLIQNMCSDIVTAQ